MKHLKEVLTMAFSFDDLREKVTDLAQSGVAKSKQLAEIAKLKTSNMGEEDTIKKAYLELGRLYYAERGAAPEGPMAAACGRISQAKAAIETNNARIAELKAQGCVEEAESVTAEPVVEDVPPRSQPPSRRSRRPRQRRPLPPRRHLPPRRSPSRTYDPIGQRPDSFCPGLFRHRMGPAGDHCGRRRMTMKQYFRRPQDVVGEDRRPAHLLEHYVWQGPAPAAGERTVGVHPGELKMLQEQIEHEG